MSYLAQPLLLQLQPTCTGTYLRWLSPLGTWEGWLFPGDLDTKTEVTDATDLATPDARAQVAVRRAGLDTWIVRAGDLTTAQHQAIAESLLSSPQVYEQLPDGRRRPVFVSPSATAGRTSADTRHELELEVKLPPRNALTH